MTALVPHPSGGFTLEGDPGEECYGGAAPRVSVTPYECSLLQEWARGKRVLEIGTGTGVSASAMSLTAAEVVTVDVSPWVAGNVFPGFASNVTPLLGREKVEGRFQMAFIDGDHTAGHPEEDYKFCLKFLEPGSKVVFHDSDAINLRFCPNFERVASENGLAVVTLVP